MARENEIFEILVNGIPRSYRDVAAYAVAGGQMLKGRDASSQVIVVNRSTREWAVIADMVSEPKWQPASQMPEARARAAP
jgi:hypothetical protein